MMTRRTIEVLLIFAMIATGESLFADLYAQSVFPVRDSLNGEAEDRMYHVYHYRIEVSFDEAKRSMAGHVTTTLMPFQTALKTVEFDAEDMQVTRVMAGATPLAYEMLPKKLRVVLDHSYSWGDTIALSIDYSCTPKKGMYFIQPDSGFPSKPRQIWTQGEDSDNHFWFPCYDFPNDKASTEVIATVNDRYVVLSNGRLVSVKDDNHLHTKTFHWKQDLPHSSYLVMLAVGEYSILRDSAGAVPLEYYVYPGRENDARASFAETPAIMKFFNQKIGFPYPWAQYAQVAIADFMYGGMENTSATTLADESILLNNRSRIDGSAVGLIAHEMAHQWWGDIVTCKDWRHLWLNEGFASYFDPLYTEVAKGKDDFSFEMHNAQESSLNTDRALGRKPIVSVGSYSSNVYARGASVLHMLRFVLGDDLFWKAIRHYITQFSFQAVDTNDLKKAIEEATGRNLYWFFDEWVYKAGHPVFAVGYHWEEATGTLTLSVSQKQGVDSLTGVFCTPVDVEVTTASGRALHHVFLSSKDTTLAFGCKEQPRLVIFDKGNWLLKELHFEKSWDEWKYQAVNALDAVDRLQAVRELAAEMDSTDAVTPLSRIVFADHFPRMRRQAVLALGGLRLHGAAKAFADSVFLAAAHDHDPAVRTSAVEQLGEHHVEGSGPLLVGCLGDSSYAVASAAITAFAKVDSEHALKAIVPFLTSSTPRNTLATAALYAIAKLDSFRAITAAWQLASYGKHPLTRYAALNVLGRYSSVRGAFVERLEELLGDKNRFVRSTVIRLLGEYGDESAIPKLQEIADTKNDESRVSAYDSIIKLRSRLALN